MLESATQLEKYCALRAGVEELQLALKAEDATGAAEWLRALAEMLDAEITPYGDEGKETYAAIYAVAKDIKWSEQLLDRFHLN